MPSATASDIRHCDRGLINFLRPYKRDLHTIFDDLQTPSFFPRLLLFSHNKHQSVAVFFRRFFFIAVIYRHQL